jgi:hypothetical protein
MLTGEERAWEALAELSTEDVCRRAGVSFDTSSGLYAVKSFGQAILVSPKDREMLSRSPTGRLLLGKLGRYYKLPVLWYLIGAKDIPLSGELIKPSDTAGGQIYMRGTHVLPLDRIAERYGGDVQGFLRRGGELGGEPLGYGDASLRLFPLPRVPVTILLWQSDDEFPSRAALLFDSTCKLHLPGDIIWSTAMVSALVML